MLLSEVKQYLRLDDEDGDFEEDRLLSSLISASSIYIKNATGKIVDASNDLHVLAICMLSTHWNENRDQIGKDGEIPFGLRSVLFQIKYGED